MKTAIKFKLAKLSKNNSSAIYETYLYLVAIPVTKLLVTFSRFEDILIMKAFAREWMTLSSV